MILGEPTRVLITVLTYPHPSQSHEELVCTAGITESREWVRLYPINYRYLPPERQFKKYQWIKVALDSNGHRGDSRKESRRPDLNSIVLEEFLPTNDRWAQRISIIDSLPEYTFKQLVQMYDQDKTSLGIIRPTRVLDLIITKADEEWKPAQEAALNQLLLFNERKPLRKIPYKFQYVFECEDSGGNPHRASLTDWEAGVLWLREAERLGDEWAAAENVRRKFLDDICSKERDTRFFMGTVLPYNTWLVLGVFWPPKNIQYQLF